MSLMKILTIVYFCESVFGDFFTNCGCQKKQNQDIVKHFQKMTFSQIVNAIKTMLP